MAVTATSVALVSSVPLSRGSLTPERSARHIVSASWLSLVVVAGAAGVLALAGAPVAKLALGSSYGGTTGTELGRLVAYLAFWMTVSVAFSVAFPLLFVLGRARMLPLLAVAALAVQVPIAWAGSSIAGLAGIAVGLAITTTASSSSCSSRSTPSSRPCAASSRRRSSAASPPPPCSGPPRSSSRPSRPQ